MWIWIAIIVVVVFVLKKLRESGRGLPLGNFRNLRKPTKNAALRRELITLVHGQNDVADRLLRHARDRYPGKTEQWYLEKVIYDLRRP